MARKERREDVIDVIYEDNHLLVINKKGGELVQGDKTGDKTLLDDAKAYIKDKYNKPGDVFLHPVHRLDRPVSGAVIFARTSKSLTRMNEIFKHRKIKKEYLAIVENRPPEYEERITHYILKDETKNTSKAYGHEKTGAKKAILDYIQVGDLQEMSMLKVVPLTGRSHQIRAQLKKIGCPIVGDTKYGSGHRIDDRSICLHCYRMTFMHPVKKEEIAVLAPTPDTNPWFNFSIET